MPVGRESDKVRRIKGRVLSHQGPWERSRSKTRSQKLSLNMTQSNGLIN